MTNPKTQAALVLEAFEIGVEKLGTKPRGITHEMSEKPVEGSGAPVSVGWHPSLKLGQTYASRGCTLFNPQPSDIEVETVIGRRVYDPKPNPHSKEELVLNATKQAQEIDELKRIVAALIAGQNLKPAPVAVPESVVEPVTEPIKENTVIEPELSMTELRAEAKEYGIKTPVGTKKSDLLAQVEQARKAS